MPGVSIIVIVKSAVCFCKGLRRSALLQAPPRARLFARRIYSSGGKQEAAATAIAQHCGLECDFGFLYSVYARASGGQAVVYRANFKSGAPMRGAFFPLDALPPINDSAVRVLLRRFAKERQSGGHAVYVGDERAGAIHHLRA